MPKKHAARTGKKSEKKRPARAKAKRERFAGRSFSELQAYQKVLAEEAARLEEVCRQLTKTETASVGFDGINRIDDAVEIIYDFIDAVEMAARKEARAQRNRGAES